MKKYLNVTLTLLCVACSLGTSILMGYQNEQNLEKLNAEWRAAAAPVFQARHLQIPFDAQPVDLARALDANSVLIYAERGKWYQPVSTTKILIVPSTQEWVRLN